MTSSPNTSFELQVQQAIDRRDGHRAVELLLADDPQHRFATAFNRAMDGVNGRYIDRAYERPRATLATKVNNGTVKDVAQLLTLLKAVLTMTARHYRGRSRHDDTPRIRPRKSPAELARTKPIPLFVPAPTDPNRFRAQDAAPTDPAERSTLFRVLLREARGLDRLQRQVLRAVRGYEREHGSTFGAFRAAAQSAVCDECGKIQSIRRRAASEVAPANTVVRQVRQLFEEASRYVARRAYFCGYRPRWPG